MIKIDFQQFSLNNLLKSKRDIWLVTNTLSIINFNLGFASKLLGFGYISLPVIFTRAFLILGFIISVYESYIISNNEILSNPNLLVILFLIACPNSHLSSTNFFNSYSSSFSNFLNNIFILPYIILNVYHCSKYVIAQHKKSNGRRFNNNILQSLVILIDTNKVFIIKIAMGFEILNIILPLFKLFSNFYKSLVMSILSILIVGQQINKNKIMLNLIESYFKKLDLIFERFESFQNIEGFSRFKQLYEKFKYFVLKDKKTNTTNSVTTNGVSNYSLVDDSNGTGLSTNVDNCDVSLKNMSKAKETLKKDE